jgi:hypothetical protein
MRIAVIGWGSLIWNPGSIRLSTRWRKDGPRLPLEFSRISNDGRLTLVVHPRAEPITTYWALSAFDEIEAAVANLSERESTNRANIAHVEKLAALDDSESGSAVLHWLNSQTSVDAAIWTNLTSNWDSKQRTPFSAEAAAEYVLSLRNCPDHGVSFRRAAEYIRNAPSQVQTPVRHLLRSCEVFADTALSDVLFEIA